MNWTLGAARLQALVESLPISLADWLAALKEQSSRLGEAVLERPEALAAAVLEGLLAPASWSASWASS